MKIGLRQVVITFVIIIGALLIAVFKFGLGGMGTPVVDDSKPVEQNSSDPALISSDPPQLFEKEPLVVPPDQILKLNFSVPMQNGPEMKLKIEPPHDIDVSVENDNKTVVIKPKAPYKLGQGYTIFIPNEAKLKEEGKSLGKGYDLHFNVINYSGI